MAEAGGGVLVYLNQEGRGIGMANKMRAYALQDRGLDTVEANHQLGFDDDERDFRHGAAVLRQLGIGRVRLLTNNPAKLAVLSAQGVQVWNRVPLTVGKTAHNARYLATKAAEIGTYSDMTARALGVLRQNGPIYALHSLAKVFWCRRCTLASAAARKNWFFKAMVPPSEHARMRGPGMEGDFLSGEVRLLQRGPRAGGALAGKLVSRFSRTRRSIGCPKAA
jgi:hypothetical protein